VKAELAKVGFPAAEVGALLDADRRRREALHALEQLRAERTAASKAIRDVKDPAERERAIEAQRAVGERIAALEAAATAAEEEFDRRMLEVPNLPHPAVPVGPDESANVLVRTVGEPRTFDFAPRPHWELGASLGILDLPAGAKITGSGFPVFRGLGARLVRALSGFMLDLHTREHGYEEVATPYLVNRATLTGTGQLPKFEEDLYAVPSDDLFLIPTAEVPVTNLHRDEILEAADLPRGYCTWTPCFRREAGAHGKDTRGLIRVHQFDKVELVRFARPEDSPAEHQRMTGHAEAVLRRLDIPYRVVELAAGDTGFASARTFDLEVWAAGVGTWLEASSSSTFTDFQARRANIRYRPEPKAKPEFVHTLNASGVAFPRTIIALLENNQAADGSVRVPEALVPYLGVDRLVPRA